MVTNHHFDAIHLFFSHNFTFCCCFLSEESNKHFLKQRIIGNTMNRTISIWDYYAYNYLKG